MSGLANPVTFGALFVAGLAILLLSVLAWRSHAKAPHIGPLTVTLLSLAQIVIVYSFSFSPALNFDQHVAAIRATYIGWLIGPVAMVLFVARVTGRDRWIRPWVLSLLVAMPVGFAIVIFGPWAIDLFFGGGFDPETFAFPRTSPIYLLFFVWIYSMLTVAVVLTVISAVKTQRLHRYQVALVLTVILVPWALNTLSFMNFRILGIGPAVLSLIPVSIAVYGIATFRAFDLRPMTKEESVFGSPTGVVVLDSRGRVSAINPTAVHLLGPGRSPAMGLGLEEVWSHRPEVVAALRGAPVDDIVIGSSVDDVPLTFGTTVMTGPNGRRTGTFVVIRPDEVEGSAHA